MKNKKTKIAIIGIIALVLVTIGVTYAYWLITRTQEGENVITTGCLDISLSGENDITLNNQFPISDEDGMKLTPYRLATNKSPKLSCTQDADKYTVSSVKGNGLLTKPIGLLTADEIAMAGATGASNSNFYLYTGSSYVWSMTPHDFGGGSAIVWNVDSDNYMYGGYVGNGNHKARPVINLKANVLFEGNGTIDSPYEIVTE